LGRIQSLLQSARGQSVFLFGPESGFDQSPVIPNLLVPRF